VRVPSYARKLMERRADGEEFWLAIVAVGWLRDADTLRGQAGIARIGCPADSDPARLDWRCLLGLDVLVTMYEGCTPAFSEAAQRAVWAANPSTVWMNLSNGMAQRVEPAPLSQPRWIAVTKPARLDETFRDQVRHQREVALITSSAPLFSLPQFDTARAQLLDRWSRRAA
jgi:hypothetical protein